MTGAADYDLINLLYYSAGVYSIQGLADAREALEDDIVNILTLDVDFALLLQYLHQQEPMYGSYS
jgi:hypothetical protein